VIYNEEYKLIHYPEYGESELFNLDNDPSESINLAEDLPEKRKELNQLLDNWLISIKAPTLTLNPTYSP